MKSRQRKWRNLCAGSRLFPSSLYFKTSLRAKSLLLILVFFDIEIRTNYRDKHFTLTLTLKKKETERDWEMVYGRSHSQQSRRGSCEDRESGSGHFRLRVHSSVVWPNSSDCSKSVIQLTNNPTRSYFHAASFH